MVRFVNTLGFFSRRPSRGNEGNSEPSPTLCALDDQPQTLLTVWVKAREVVEYLRRRYTSHHRLGEPFQVLISTILSQRTREENTERASNRLFSKYKTAREIAEAPIRQLEELIRPAGFYRVKARKIRKTSAIILEKYGGNVPTVMDELLLLPGVGQKTANCVLAYGFDISAFPVDVHVHRISNRLGLVSTRSPIETEKALKQIFPEETWSSSHDRFWERPLSSSDAEM